MKNPNGYGSVINLGKGRRKPFAVRLTISLVDGKQMYRYVGYYATKKEAVQALAKEQVQPTSLRADLTFKEIYGEWSSVHFLDISKQTQDNYRASFKHLSSLHASKFVNLRTSHYQRIIDGLERSASTKSKIVAMCSQLYNYAMQNDICNKNYAEFIVLHKVKKQEKEIFNDIEIQKLFKATKDGTKYADIILILIYTGLRISELLNLTKFQIDTDNMIITGGVKTDAGKNRVVPIHPKIQDFVKKYYDSADTFLFCRADNTKITPDYFRKHIYYDILERLRITRKTPHSTRHTFASMLAKAGSDTIAIQKIIGHSNYSTTANLYTHTDFKYLHDQIKKIN